MYLIMRSHPKPNIRTPPSFRLRLPITKIAIMLTLLQNQIPKRRCGPMAVSAFLHSTTPTFCRNTAAPFSLLLSSSSLSSSSRCPLQYRRRNVSTALQIPSLRMSSTDGDENATNRSMSSWMEKNRDFERYDNTSPTPSSSSSSPSPSSSKSVSDYNREFNIADRKRLKQKRRRTKKSGVEHNNRMESMNREYRKMKEETFQENFRGTRVFVQNLPDYVNWQELKDHFKKAGEVVFASVSIDGQTGQSKCCGVVQYETTEMAKQAIKTMRDHPLDGNVLYVREDFQEQFQARPDTTDNTDNANPQPSSSPRKTLATVWHCADESNASHLPPSEVSEITKLIQTRDRARRARNYEVSDRIRDDLKVQHRVHLDDRLKTWWYSIDGSTVPDSIMKEKGDGRWGKGPLREWRMIPTTEENDACVSTDLVEGLLRQRDIARREKDFKTADRLLEEAKYSLEGGDMESHLLIRDDDRTYRVWTVQKPRFETKTMTGAEKCIALVEKHEPEKVEELKDMLRRFPGREYSILKRLKENYFK